MTEFITNTRTPSLLHVSILSNNDVVALANSIRGKGRPVIRPAYKPEPLTGTLSAEEKPAIELFLLKLMKLL